MLNELATGRIIKGIAGFYTVAGEAGEMMEASARGRIRQDDELLVGDFVRFRRTEPGKCVIEEILPRESVLKRPYIANADQVCLVFALKDPDYNTIVIDRFTVLVGAAGLKTLLVLNKADLVAPSVAERLAKIYREIGMKVIITSTIDHRGKRLLARELRDRVAVLAGPSGVGKTALLNLICPGHALQTGELSAKIGRGRHTTRQVQLIPLSGGGFVADTPGFTQIDLDFLKPESLAELFPEFTTLESCRFRGCVHLKEPDCSIKEAVESGKVHRFRYEHYQEFYEEILRFYNRRYR